MRSVIALVLSFGLIAAAAAENKASFADWLAATSGKNGRVQGAVSPSQDGDYYEGEVETVDRCMRAVSKRNCGPDAAPVYSEYGLTCCDSEHYNSYHDKELSQYLGKPMEVGDCQITETAIGSIDVSETVTKTHTFVAQCSLSDKSDECGHPFCDKMVLTIVGSKYTFKNAIVSNLPTSLHLEGSCKSGSSPPTPVPVPVPVPAPEPVRVPVFTPNPELQAKTAYENQEYGNPPPTPWGAKAQAMAAYESEEYGHKHYKVTEATVYHGTMTVNSRLHSVKFTDGTFQFMSYVQTTGAEAATHAEVKESYVMEPYKVELSFYKPKEPPARY